MKEIYQLRKKALLLSALLLTTSAAALAQATEEPDEDSPFLVEPRDEHANNIYHGYARWYILKTGELVIRGMEPFDYLMLLPNYYKGGTPAWLAYKDVITKVTVKHQIITNGLLQGLDKVTYLDAPMTEEIDYHAFMGFGAPEVVMNIPKLKKINGGGMFGCNARVLNFPTVEELGPDAITHCPNLEVVNLGSNIKMMSAGALAYNPKMVRADGDNRPSLFISAPSAPDYARNYPKTIGDKIMEVVAPLWIDAFQALFKKGESAALKWADGKTGGLASTAYKKFDLQEVVFNYVDELKPKEKGYCCLFGDLTEGNINVAVPDERLSTYKTAYSGGIAIKMEERPEAGYMAYNHKAEDNGSKGEKRQVGKFVSGNFYNEREYECDGVYYYDCRGEKFDGASTASMKRISATNELRLLRCAGISSFVFDGDYVKQIKTVTLPSHFDDQFTTNPYMPCGSEVIEDWAFRNSPIKELRGHVSKVGREAFLNCTKLTSVKLDRASEIGERAFKGCTSLYSISGSSQVSTIGESAFDGCKALTASVDLNAEEISNYAFRGCPLSGITLGNGVKTVGREAFAGSRPTSISAQKVTTIRDYAFAADTYAKSLTDEEPGQGHLQTVELPAIQNIGERAFENQMLRPEEDTESDFTITLGKSLKLLGHRAFAGCRGLEDRSGETESGITMKSSRPAGGNEVFYGMDRRFVKLSVPGEYTDAYKASDVYDEFQISNDLKAFPITFTLGDGYADLFGDGRLEVTGGADLASSYAQPWRYCASLIKKINISDEVTRIGKNCFSGLPELTEVSMKNSVKEIDEYAFSNCPKLQRVKLSEKVVTISKSAFSGCKALEEVNFPTSLEVIGPYAFYNCANLPAYATFPDKLKRIEEYAFGGCSAFTHLSFKDKLESIGENAFRNAPVTNIVCTAPQPPTCKWAFGSSTDDYTKIALDVPDHLRLPYFFAEGDWERMQSSFTDAEHGKMIAHSVNRENMDSEIEGYSVVYEDGYATYTSLMGEGKYAYAFNDGADHVRMPDEVCARVKVLAVPEGITGFVAARYQYPNLEKLILPLSCTEMYLSLEGLTKLKSVDLGNVTEIPDNCFDGCTALADIDLHKVKRIGRFAFRNCTSLKEVDLSAANSGGEPLNTDERKVAVLGEEAFAGSGLTTVAVACEFYNKKVFANCKGLHKVELSNWMNGTTLTGEGINTGVFDGCVALDTIICHMPTALVLDEENFSDVTRKNVKLLVRPGAETSFSTTKGWQGFNVVVDEILSPILPTGGISPTIYAYTADVVNTIWSLDEDGVLKLIGTPLQNSEFKAAYTTNRDCINYFSFIKKIQIDDDVEAVLSEYFLKTNYPNCTELEFGAHVKAIAPLAFREITPNLQHIYCYAPVPPMHLDALGRDAGKDAGVFSNIENKAAVMLHVLNEEEVIEAYKNHSGWNEFTIVGDLTRRAEYDYTAIGAPRSTSPASGPATTVKVLGANGQIYILRPDGIRYTLQGVKANR